MKISYKVHRISAQPATIEANLPSGEAVAAVVDGLDVELVPVSHPAAGTVKLHYVGSEAAAAQEKFSVGADVHVDWSAVEVVPVPTASE